MKKEPKSISTISGQEKRAGIEEPTRSGAGSAGSIPLKPRHFQIIYKNEDDRRIAQILFKIIVAILAVYLIVIFNAALFWQDWNLAAFTLAGSIVLIVPLGLLARGYVRASGLIVALDVLGTVTALATIGQGIYDIAIIAYPVIVVVASLILRRRDYFLSSALILCAMGWLVFGEAYGLYAPLPRETPGGTDFVIVVTILLVAVITVDLLAENLRENLRQARKEIERRKTVEDALRESEARYRDLFDNALDLIQSVDPDGHILFVNRTWRETLGYSEEEVGKLSLIDILDSSCRERCLNLFQQLMKGESISSIEAIFLTKDGRSVVVEGCSSVHFENGAPVSTRSIFRDITKRKQTEEALRESEERFQTIYEMEPECVKILNPDCTLAAMNPAGLAMIEVESLDMVKGQSILPIVDEEFREKFKRFTENVCQNGESGELEFKMIGLKGTPRWLHTHAVPLRDSNGKLSRLLGVTRDITERKQVDEFLKESEAKFKAQYKGLPIPTYSWKRTGNDFVLVDSNDAADEITKGHIHHFIGKTAREMYSDTPEILNDLENCFIQQVTIRREMQMLLHSTGEARDFIVHYAFITPDLVMVHTLDITERKRAEEKLRASEARFRIFADHTYDWEFWQNPGGEFIYTSPACLPMSGHSAGEFAQDAGLLLRIIHPDDRPHFVEHQRRIRQDHAKSEIEFRILKPDQSVRWIGHFCQPIFDEQSRFLGTRGSHRDITESKRTEEALRESEALFHQMFSEHAAIGLLVDLDSGAIVDVNPAASRFYGYPIEAMREMNMSEINPLPREQTAPATAGAAVQHALSYFLFQHRLASGEIRDVEVYSSPLQVKGRALLYSIVHDVTERKRADDALRYLSTHDMLTGIFNRAFFETELARLEFSRHYPVSIVMVDLDNMKVTNDKLGHAQGDELLKHTAQILQSMFRPSDIVARIGGDEFAILLPQTNAVMVEQMLERIYAKLAEHNTEYPGLPVQLSLGAATAEKEKLAEAFAIADRRMYADKARHKSKDE